MIYEVQLSDRMRDTVVVVDFSRLFGDGTDPLRYAREQAQMISAAEEDQRRQMNRVAEQMAEAAEQRAEEQQERDRLQRELVELQRHTAARDRERDEREKLRQAEREAADMERDRTERERKCRELYRWFFTTALTIAALVVAIISLATR